MNIGLLVKDGDRFGEPVIAVPPTLLEPADISPITQQYTLVLQVVRLGGELQRKTQSVAAKSEGQHKAECFLLPEAELPY